MVHQQLKQDIASELCVDCEWHAYIGDEIGCGRKNDDGVFEQCEAYKAARTRHAELAHPAAGGSAPAAPAAGGSRPRR